ncbi:hypothetical protein [Mesorhizobium sp. BR-1-1-10]|uniref:hypothetical protein n=1 Tax=Mesorhizobium sp. BR-1-1-10 TaxID=2876660 RepID=UPI001CD10516|nr:hypothetical protein [Mesorhizobium sp. BR-1-1-10]MBZ9976134.1 hypothetical protein [Mesorhizobium sp. BR-1-1-10]
MVTRKPTGVEYRFKIDAYTPETMPMARLAEYMAELAVILGEQGAVHFTRLERGSTVMVQKIEAEAAPKVRDRVARVKRQQDAPEEALRAFRTMNRLLREDNGAAVLKEKTGVIIEFPGIKDEKEKYPPVKQHGTLDGILVAVGGAETVHIRLRVENEIIAGISTTDRQIGKELARRFDEPVRLTGMGTWHRNDEGRWDLVNFKVEGFCALETGTLTEALTEIRELPYRFEHGAFDELETLRHGPPQANGSH